MSAKKSTLFYSVLIALTSIVAGMVLASTLGLSPVSFAGSVTVPPTNSAPLTGAIDATTFRTIAQDASPTVVSIRTTQTRPGGGLEDFLGFQNPFRERAPQGRQAPPQIVQGAGSGFVIDKNGYILTNNHVVEDASEIEVKLSDMDSRGKWLHAKVVGTDVLTDSALIQLTELPDHPLAVSKFGDSAQIAQGDWVMAIGNPFSLGNTVTVGIVSAIGRQQPTAVNGRVEEMIQTDAAINRGNSGGPLLNIRGEVVGINTQILSDQGGGNLGIGFAVPINTVRNILPQLEKGKVVRGRIGVRVSPTPMTREDAEDLGLPGVGGAEITDVTDGGPAKLAGVRAGDVVIEFNGKPVHNSDGLVAMVVATTPGTTVPIKIIRNKKTQTLNVKVEELDVQAEQNLSAPVRPDAPDEQPKETGFGMSIEGLSPGIVRRLGLPTGVGGAIVSDVEPGSPAAQGGIRPNDVIIQVGGVPVTSVTQASKALDAVQPGRTARIIVWRNGQEQLALVRKR